MRTALRLALALTVAVGVTVPAATPPIRPDALLAHIKFLSSDDLRGRANGSDELERAGEYVADQFKQAGLHPAGDKGDWLQGFELLAGLTVGTSNALVIGGRGRSVSFTLGTSYYPLAVMPNEDERVPSTTLDDVPIVFAGYGLSAASV